MAVRAILVLSLALLCAACGTSGVAQRPSYMAEAITLGADASFDHEAAALQPLQAAAIAPAPAQRVETYMCFGGDVLSVRYSEDSSRVIVQLGDGRAIRLRRAAAEGVAAYTGDGITFRRAGPRAAWADERVDRPRLRQCRRRLSDAYT